jgi:ribose 1,5-bisphosphokinase PhnN
MLSPMASPYRFLIIIGPSGAGKSSVVRELDRLGAIRVQPTWTTRVPREEEREGSLEHCFVSEAEFEERLRAGFFCQTGVISGLPHRYGMPSFVPRPDGPVDTVILRAPYVDTFRCLIPGPVVYQIEDRRDRIELRLQSRQGSSAEAMSRIRDNINESLTGRRIAHRTFINDGPIEALMHVALEAMTIDLPGRSGRTQTEVAI